VKYIPRRKGTALTLTAVFSAAATGVKVILLSKIFVCQRTGLFQRFRLKSEKKSRGRNHPGKTGVKNSWMLKN